MILVPKSYFIFQMVFTFGIESIPKAGGSESQPEEKRAVLQVCTEEMEGKLHKLKSGIHTANISLQDSITEQESIGGSSNNKIPNADNRRNTRRILQGSSAEIKQFPYMVSIRVNNTPICGGSIINHWFILTAAHCVYKTEESSIKINAGTNLAKAHTRNLLKIDYALPHKKFTFKDPKYDIALIKLCKPLKYKDTLSFVRLASRGTEIEPGTLATIVGWGMTKYTDKSSYPAVLQTAKIPIMNLQICNKHYRGVWALTNYQICAGYKEGGIDACMGDSGGPLVLQGIQIGIVSFGDRCGEPNFGGIYIKVSAYRHWIKKFSGV